VSRRQCRPCATRSARNAAFGSTSGSGGGGSTISALYAFSTGIALGVFADATSVVLLA